MNLQRRWQPRSLSLTRIPMHTDETSNAQRNLPESYILSVDIYPPDNITSLPVPEQNEPVAPSAEQRPTM